MSEPLIEPLIQEKTAALAVLQRHITTHETIRLVLKDLHRPTIAADQALTLLQHETEHIHELARADRFHQVVAQPRQMPVEVHSASASRWRTSCTPDAQKQGIL